MKPSKGHPDYGKRLWKLKKSHIWFKAKWKRMERRVKQTPH